MPDLIAEEQTCGVHGRNIHNNLMILRDTTDYVNYNIEAAAAAAVCFDQEKAFDRIEWEYMFAMMSKMGMPMCNGIRNPFLTWLLLSIHCSFQTPLTGFALDALQLHLYHLLLVVMLHSLVMTNLNLPTPHTPTYMNINMFLLKQFMDCCLMPVV